MENNEGNKERELTPESVRAEIKRTRHKAERPLYWIFFVINFLVYAFIAFAGWGSQFVNPSDYPEEQVVYEIMQMLGIGLFVAALIVMFISLALGLYSVYVRELAYSIRVTPKNFPEIYEKGQEYTRLLGFKKAPEIYIIQNNGILNAFASFVFGRRYIQLNAEIVDIAYMENKDFSPVYFILAHEFGHQYFNHVTIWHNLSIMFGKMIPVIGSIYNRSYEYSCDRVAQALTGTCGVREIGVLAAGRHLYPYFDAQDYVENVMKERNIIERIGFLFWQRRWRILTMMLYSGSMLLFGEGFPVMNMNTTA